jgi:hypothetical protein
MPLVTKKPQESRDEFISRCMRSDKMIKEFPNQKQRAGVCYGQLKR